MNQRMQRERITGKADGLLVIIYVVLCLLGWLHVWSAAESQVRPSPFDPGYEPGKQLIWMGICTGVALVLMLLDTKVFPAFRSFAYAASLGLLVLVLIIGQEVGGNKSWIVLGSSIKIQPSEFAKYATALMLAGFMSTQQFNPRINKHWFFVFGIILIPAMLVLLEKDTGSTLVYAGFILALFRFGLNRALLFLGLLVAALFLASLFITPWYLVLGLVTVAALVWFFVFRKNKRSLWPILLLTLALSAFTLAGRWVFDHVLLPHQQTRIKVLFNPDLDPRGSGWNVNNSKMALGSGGLAGKGFLKGSLTQLKFVPKQHTDFIFSAIGEQWGFLGTSFVILLYLGLLYRLVWKAEAQRSEFAKVFGYLVACILFFHFFMNVGTTIGLAPAVGVPLPFVSYGGSSLLGFTLLLFTFIKLDAHNKEVLR